MNPTTRKGTPRHRVVVTGLGALTPVGLTVESTWDALVEGQSGAEKVTRFDTTDYPTQIGCELKGFDPLEYVEKKEARRLDPAETYALAATAEAFADAGLAEASLDKNRCGVIIGSGIGGIKTFESQVGVLHKSGPGRVSPFFIPMMIIDMCAGLVSMKYGFKGPNYATVSACASSANAVGDAMRLVERGDVDLILAGGAEATITPTAFAGFCASRALSTRNDEPHKASRPFDIGRDGFVMGEGAGMLVLESLEHANKRGAKIVAEIIGVGLSSDAYHITQPAPNGEGAARAMQHAIHDAEVDPTEVDYINSHGTSTNLGDICEVEAIKTVFGDHARDMVVNSSKSMIGHLLGAAGAVELIATIKALQSGTVHPTINLDDPDPQCDLDFVPNEKRERPVRVGLTNSFGFGGHNVSLAVRGVNGASG